MLFVVGLVLIIKGGDWFVDGASALARRFHLPELLIGATVVSIGTTLPEVMVSTTSALTGHGEIAYGNAIGSVICNAALIGEWAGSAEELLAVCQRLEREAGRPEKHSSRESRPLDLDLIPFGDERRETAFLRLPHPRAQERGFVLMPLAEVAGKWRFPDSGRTVRECLENLPPEKLN